MMIKKIMDINLRLRTLLAMGILLVGLIVIIYVVLNFIITNSVDQLEKQFVEDQIGRVQSLISDDISNVSKVAEDWAPWDDTYEFITNASSEFINKNNPIGSLMNLDLGMMIFINRVGNIVYSVNINPETGEEFQLPAELIKQLDKSMLFSNFDEDFYVDGIVLLGEGPMLIGSHPILTTEYKGPSRGNLVTGTFLDASRIEKLREKLNLDIKISPLNDFYLDGFPLFEDQDSILIKELDKDNIAGLALIKDIFGQPILGLKVTMPRGIANVGRLTMKYILFSLMVIGVVFTVAVLLFMEKNILSRLQSLCLSVNEISAARSVKKRVKSDRYEDELSSVIVEINGMLDKLNDAEQEIRKTNDELEQKVQERTLELSISNEALQQEVIERKKTEEKIKFFAYYDHLTELPNRILFIDRATQVINDAKKTADIVAVMFLDLDDFKLVNDTMGHAFGDELLKEAARRLSGLIGKNDTIARVGGDEFLILVQNYKAAESVEMLAGKIIDSFNHPFSINGQILFITASIGIALFPEDGEEVDTIIKNADVAMYCAKDIGRNKFAFCTAEMKNKVLETMEMTSNLYRALDRNELAVYYQPQVSCNTGKIVGMEALIRWMHGERGMISPKDFIPIAENTGLINSIGEWVLQTACKQNKIWQDAGLPKLRVGVNVSTVQFQNPNFTNQVFTILQNTGLDSKWLELEVTENIVIREPEFVINILNSFRKQGVSIAIDDFGTEYSSMSYLKQLPVDRIKIAMQFIKGIEASEKDEAIVKTIIVLAKSLGLNVIAEGVETEKQLEFLAKRKCNDIQGFYFYKPMAADKMEKLLREME